MSQSTVTRAHLKSAFLQCDWEQLEELLSSDPSLVNDNSMFTDTWGLWWGMLYQAVIDNAEPAVRVLLKHGADPSLGTRGDGVEASALDLAADKPAILALLSGAVSVENEPRPRDGKPLRTLTADEQKFNERGSLEHAHGLIFPTPASADSDSE